MGDSRKGKSIWRKFEKPKVEAKVENDGKLYFRINKRTGRADVVASQASTVGAPRVRTTRAGVATTAVDGA